MELDPQPGPIVQKQPPDPIKEIPPAQQPEGDNIVWIPGYWAWDDDRNDFLWVSGVLRAPPGQTWVPGYWSKVDGGFQWTPGLWTANTKQEVSYLPQPPQSLENGPSSPQPAENQFWIPGAYVYQNADYYWRPGYWTVARPNWIWIPAHYAWTPAGYVFVEGYWDYELTRRGCLFAPVYFAQPVYAQPAFVFTPTVVFNVGLFSDCLFVRPAYCHYYFGDYFAPRYAGIGFSPWFSITIGNRPHCDPLFTYYRWHNSLGDRNWLAHTQQHFDTLRRDEALRPPRTFAAEQQWMKKNPGAKPGDMALVSSLKDVAKDPKSDFKFRNVSLTDRQALAARGNELQQVAQQRDTIERKNNALGLNNRGNNSNAASGANTPRNFTFNNPGNAGAGNNAGTGTNNLGSNNGPKFKLPTAAASNIALSNNTPAGDNNSQQPGGNFNRKFDGSKFDGQKLGSDSNSQPKFGQQNSQGVPRQGMIQPGNSFQSNGGQQTGGNNPGKLSTGDSNNPLFPNKGPSNLNLGAGNPGTGASALGNGSPRNPMFPNSGNTSANSGAGGNSGNSGGNKGFIRSPAGNGGGGGGGGGSGNKDKDDKKNKNSSNTSPHPYTDYQAHGPSLIDVEANSKEDHKSSQTITSLTADKSTRTSTAGLDLLHSNDKSRDSTSDDEDSTKDEKSKNDKKSASYQLPPLFRKSTAPQTDPRLKWLLGDQTDSPAPESDQSQASDSGDPEAAMPDTDRRSSGNQPTDKNASSKTAMRGTGSGQANGPQSPAAPKNPAISIYDYQTMFERGRTMSTRNSYAANPLGTLSSESSNVPAPMPRATKDPVSTMGANGYGNGGSGAGVGGGEGRIMYGPQNFSSGMNAGYTSGMPTGPANSGGPDMPRGSGSYISNNAMPQMPHFDLHMNRPTGPASIPDPGARTYDPSRGY